MRHPQSYDGGKRAASGRGERAPAAAACAVCWCQSMSRLDIKVAAPFRRNTPQTNQPRCRLRVASCGCLVTACVLRRACRSWPSPASPSNCRTHQDAITIRSQVFGRPITTRRSRLTSARAAQTPAHTSPPPRGTTRRSCRCRPARSRTARTSGGRRRPPPCPVPCGRRPSACTKHRPISVLNTIVLSLCLEHMSSVPHKHQPR